MPLFQQVILLHFCLARAAWVNRKCSYWELDTSTSSNSCEVLGRISLQNGQIMARVLEMGFQWNITMNHWMIWLECFVKHKTFSKVWFSGTQMKVCNYQEMLIAQMWCANCQTLLMMNNGLFFPHSRAGLLALFQVPSIVEAFFFFLDDSFLFQHGNDQVHRSL